MTYASLPAMRVVHSVVFATAKTTVGIGRILPRELYEVASAAYIIPTTTEYGTRHRSVEARQSGPWERTETGQKECRRKEHDTIVMIPDDPYSPNEHRVT